MPKPNFAQSLSAHYLNRIKEAKRQLYCRFHFLNLKFNKTQQCFIKIDNLTMQKDKAELYISLSKGNYMDWFFKLLSLHNQTLLPTQTLVQYSALFNKILGIFNKNTSISVIYCSLWCF
jgi:hypothetical protein